MGFLDENKKSNEEAKKSYEEMKGAYEALRQDLRQDVNRLTAAVDKVAAPSFKQTIESRDRELLEDVTRQMQDISEELRRNVAGLKTVDNDHHRIFYFVSFAFVFVVLFCFYNMYQMRKEVEATNEKYELITSILSGDSHYWFNGENYTIGRESPTGEYFQKVYNDYQEKKQQQQQQKQN